MDHSLADKFATGQLSDPFSFLGARPARQNNQSGILVRAYCPGAIKATAFLSGGQVELISLGGSWADYLEGFAPVEHNFDPYRLKVEFSRRVVSTFYDAYSFRPVLGEMDLFLWNQGNHYQIYHKLGAHPTIHQGVPGVVFAVWAPSAKKVSLVSDRNQWDGRRLRLRPRGSSGVWEIFVPHYRVGEIYKYEITTQENIVLIKADPMGFQMEVRPKTASVIADLGNYSWSDSEWLSKRARTNFLTQPMSIYEVHLGSWKRKEDGSWLTYREMADLLVPYISDMGFNWLEMMPLAEHPFDASWGYQVSGYYAITSRFGGPDDFRYLVDCCHQNGIGVILDWVPAHFPRDSFALEYFDGTHLYEHADPRQGTHSDWGTLVFNYGRNEVKNFLVANALFLVDEYHIDALRVDAVASMLYLDYSRKEGEWIPNRYGGRENLEAMEMIKTLNTKLYEFFPGAMTIAEESTAFTGVSRPVHLGGLGFMFKWNMGWMHDMLDFMSKDPIYRRYNMERLTFALLYAFQENFCLPLSHDEVVYGKKSLWDKMPGNVWEKCANLRLLLGYMFGEPGKKMLFMGGEFGQRYEWDHNSQLSWDLLDLPEHRGLREFVRDLNALYKTEPALFSLDFDWRGFEWVDFRDADSTVVSFLRRSNNPDDTLLFVFNFTPVIRRNYRLGVPSPGFWRELINSDSFVYGGSNVGLGGGLLTETPGSHGREQCLDLTLPPLGFLVLKRS
ncbi:MAG: 1,4-alpha-glucan branching protein GlgB [Deltaproteobacteria bacterium]|jgi:1,4-alpha-glucan branching enzyme|nr:1,4-alpha-glucan branching protein GlgB [Deltaproteobacteria bacterium]